MITLSTFQEYLSATKLQSTTARRSVDNEARYLQTLLTGLPSQTHETHAERLEEILKGLQAADMEEEQRLKLTACVIEAAEQLIVALRQHYIYETAAFSEAQMAYVAQVRSLYYLVIMIYDGVIQREMTSSIHPDKSATKNGWQRYLNHEKRASAVLALAIYQSLLMYQKLLGEAALCYQKPSSYLWSKINQLYYLAHQQRLTLMSLSAHTLTQRADSIHRLYCQLCLHSLLNVRAMRRPNILLVQRLLPEWAEHLLATIEPESETRVFVNLKDNQPPTYLTAHSCINPYEDRYECLFIELTPMIAYLQARRQALIKEGREAVACALLNKVIMTLTYRYLQPQLTLPTKYSSKQDAVVIGGFNDMHYRVSQGCSFTRLIVANELPEAYRPHYDTHQLPTNTHTRLNAETFDGNDTLSLFRILRLRTEPASMPADRQPPTRTGQLDSSPLPIDADIQHDTSHKTRDERVAAPVPLQIMRLFLLCRAETATTLDCSIGLTRWVNADGATPEIEWQVLGHNPAACGLRVDGDDTRDRHFVPAFIMGKDEQLQTEASLIVPTAHFQVDDRVIMRINQQQTPLRLGRRLLMTDEFSQYEVLRL